MQLVITLISHFIQLRWVGFAIRSLNCISIQDLMLCSIDWNQWETVHYCSYKAQFTSKLLSVYCNNIKFREKLSHLKCISQQTTTIFFSSGSHNPEERLSRPPQKSSRNVTQKIQKLNFNKMSFNLFTHAHLHAYSQILLSMCHTVCNVHVIATS